MAGRPRERWRSCPGARRGATASRAAPRPPRRAQLVVAAAPGPDQLEPRSDHAGSVATPEPDRLERDDHQTTASGRSQQMEIRARMSMSADGYVTHPTAGPRIPP